MTFVSKRLIVDAKPSGEVCACAGTCTGYDSCSNCPPLIVLAVLANYETAVSVVVDISGEQQ